MDSVFLMDFLIARLLGIFDLFFYQTSAASGFFFCSPAAQAL